MNRTIFSWLSAWWISILPTSVDIWTGIAETDNNLQRILILWKLTNCNWTRTQNHLVRKRTVNHLTKWLSVRLRTKWFWVRVQLQLVNLQISRLLRARSFLTFRQLQSVDSLWNAYLTWQEHTVLWKLTLDITKTYTWRQLTGHIKLNH